MEIIFIAIALILVVCGFIFALVVVGVIYTTIRYPHQYEVVIFLLSDGKERDMAEILKECKGKVSKVFISVLLHRAVSEGWLSIRAEITPWGPRNPDALPKMFWSFKKEHVKTR